MRKEWRLTNYTDNVLADKKQYLHFIQLCWIIEKLSEKQKSPNKN